MEMSSTIQEEESVLTLETSQECQDGKEAPMLQPYSQFLLILLELDIK